MGFFSSSKETDTKDYQKHDALDYKETDAARQTWWSKLQDWGNQSDYGAIPQDWAKIWDLAQQRVKGVYSGTPTTTGVYDKVKSSAARRGVSESPSMEASLTAAGVNEAQDIQQLAQEQAIAEAQFSEQGRQSWLNSLTGLSNLKSGDYTSESQSMSKTTENPSMFDNITDIAAIALALQTGGASLAIPGLGGYGMGTPLGTKNMGTWSKLPTSIVGK